MNKASIPWWSSLGFGRRVPAPDTDYADMGTAFGLDASMAALPAPDQNPLPATQAGHAPHRDTCRAAEG